MPFVTLILFNKLEVTIDVGFIILTIITMVIYNGYIDYVKSVYGITDSTYNYIIDKLPNCITILLFAMSLILAISCKWI